MGIWKPCSQLYLWLSPDEAGLSNFQKVWASSSLSMTVVYGTCDKIFEWVHPISPCRAEVFRVFFWMKHHGGASPKRTAVASNSMHIGKLDLGSLRISRNTRKSRTTRKYIDKAGKKRFVGTSALKRSQNLVVRLVFVKQLSAHCGRICVGFPNYPKSFASGPCSHQGYIQHPLPVQF